MSKKQSSPPPPPNPSTQRGRFAGFDTWDEFVEARLREFNNRPKQRRLAETERIIADWQRGGYALFCELMERATNGGICHPRYARILLPVFLEVIDEEESWEAEAGRAKRRLKLAEQAEKGKARMRCAKESNESNESK